MVSRLAELARSMKRALGAKLPCGKIAARKLQYWHDAARFVQSSTYSETNQPAYKLFFARGRRRREEEEEEEVLPDEQTRSILHKLGIQQTLARLRADRNLFLSPRELAEIQRTGDSSDNPSDAFPSNHEILRLLRDASAPKFASKTMQAMVTNPMAEPVSPIDLLDHALRRPKSEHDIKQREIHRVLLLLEQNLRRKDMLDRRQARLAKESAQRRTQYAQYSPLTQSMPWRLPIEDPAVALAGRSSAVDSIDTYTALCAVSHPETANRIIQRSSRVSKMFSQRARDVANAVPLLPFGFSPSQFARNFSTSTTSRTADESKVPPPNPDHKEQKTEDESSKNRNANEGESNDASENITMTNILKAMILGAAIGASVPFVKDMLPKDPTTQLFTTATRVRDHDYRRIIENAASESGVYQRFYEEKSTEAKDSSVSSDATVTADALETPSLDRSDSVASFTSALDEPVTSPKSDTSSGSTTRATSSKTSMSDLHAAELNAVRARRQELYSSVSAPALFKYIRELRRSSAGLRSALGVFTTHIHKLEEEGSEESLAQVRLLWPLMRTFWIDSQVELERLEDAQNALLEQTRKLRSQLDKVLNAGVESKDEKLFPSLAEAALLTQEVLEYEHPNNADGDSRWKSFVEMYSTQLPENEQTNSKEQDTGSTMQALLRVSSLAGRFPSLLLDPAPAPAVSFSSANSIPLGNLRLDLGTSSHPNSRSQSSNASPFLSSGGSSEQSWRSTAAPPSTLVSNDSQRSSSSRRVGKSTILEQSLIDPRVTQRSQPYFANHHPASAKSNQSTNTNQGWVSWGLQKIGLGPSQSASSAQDPNAPLPDTVALSRLLVAEQYRMYRADQELLRELAQTFDNLAQHPEVLHPSPNKNVTTDQQLTTLTNELQKTLNCITDLKQQLESDIRAVH